MEQEDNKILPKQPEINKKSGPIIFWFVLITSFILAGIFSYITKRSLVPHPAGIAQERIETPEATNNSPLLLPEKKPNGEKIVLSQFYTNNKIYFNYPETWSVLANDTGNNLLILSPEELTTLNAPDYTDGPLGVLIKTFESKTSETLEDWLKNHYQLSTLNVEDINQEEPSRSSTIDHIEQVTLQGSGGAYFFHEGGIAEGDYTYFLKHGEVIASITTHRESSLSNPIIVELINSFGIGNIPSFPVVYTPYENYEYSLKRRSNDYRSKLYYDQQLIQKNIKTGEEKILNLTTKSVTPAVGGDIMIKNYKKPQDSSKIYFFGFLPNTDAPPGGLYSFDLNTGKYSKLSVSSLFGKYGKSVISPNSKMIASTTSNDQSYKKLYILDLENDKAHLAVTVGTDEILSFCLGCSPGSHGYITWSNDTTIKYAVYDLNNIETGGEGPRYKLKEYRQYNVPETYDLNKIFKLGNKFGDLTVTSIDTLLGRGTISEDNLSVEFSGKIKISGEYQYDTRESPLPPLCFTPDEKSLSLLPKISWASGNGTFCFSNQQEAIEILQPVYGTPGTGYAEIEIENFNYVRCGCEAISKARLLNVISK